MSLIPMSCILSKIVFRYLDSTKMVRLFESLPFFFLLTPLLISSFNNYRFNETYYIGLVLLWSRRISRFGTFQVTYAGDFVSNNIVCFVIKFVKYYIRFSFKDMMFTLTYLTLDVSSMRAGKSN